jgi:GNAT superfamily N-acetyltransferase
MQPNVSVSLRSLSKEDLESVLEVARALPQWFTPKGLELMQVDLPYQKGWIAWEGSSPLGFISFFVNQAKGEIGWLGVLPDQQRKGIGKQLLNRLVEDLQSNRVSELYVRTLGDSVEYEPYAKTRAFYRANGFQDFQRFQHPDNPECEEELLLLLRLK